MAGGAKGGDDEELISDINVTPLVDIVLVLLIILMVTASYIVSKTIPMDLPAARTGESVTTTLAISIDREGRIYLDAQPVTEQALRQHVRNAARRDSETRAVIAAHGQTIHANVVHVIDILRQERVTKFAINVRPEDLRR